MKERNVRRIMIVTAVLATFVLYLCAGVSKLLPFIIAVALTVIAVASAEARFTPISELVRGTQKRE